MKKNKDIDLSRITKNTGILKRNSIAALAIGSVITASLFLAATATIMTQNVSAAVATTSTGLASETIDVRARAITVTLPQIGTVTGYHLFIIYTDRDGAQFVCQGYPFDPVTGEIPPHSVIVTDPPGLLTLGRCVDYLPGNPDYISDAPSVTVATGKTAHMAYECFVEKTDLFNAAKVPYHEITGPNSNTYARTMLDSCDVPAIKPTSATLTPGWDISIHLAEDS